jgi:transcription-repair coupling factor (superfamily II helicase)
LRILDARSLFPSRSTSPTRSRLRPFDLGDLKEGDYVVHKEYGIGRFMGLKRLEVDGEEVDTVEIAYEGEDRLFLPVTRLALLSPYLAGVGEEPPRLDRLRSSEFKERRARAKEDLLRFAGELLKLYADRAGARRPPLASPGELSLSVEASFPYEETPDQIKVMREIEEDLEKDRPMDRLLVGDVGFGKTEIALRTAIRFIENGYQVALLAPTTILVTQHGITFQERLKDLPVRMATLTRFTPSAEEREILRALREGTLDLVIGTHRLLMPDVAFKNLGLVIVDEEHRFGVKQKEALKSLRKNVDSLALSATPIPRTLEIHLSGIRDLSTLFTPPPGRLEVETRVLPLTEEIIKEAIERERRRGGQIFILYNLIEGLEEKLQWIQSLVPDLKIAMIHGKMPAREIRRVFEGFRQGTIEALLATTIIESGLDFPSANTLIVLDAHQYGLADLYQLRGRVGRSSIRAFCYFFYPPETTLSPSAQARLSAIQSFAHLGSGLGLALMDLEIRGAGEFLGKRQSGHIRSLGFFTTLKLLEEAIAEARGEERTEMIETELEGDYPPSLSPTWIPDPSERLRIYHRLFSALTPQEAESAIQEILDRFGPPPTSRDEEFLDLMELRPLFPLIGVRTARFSSKTLRLWISDRSPLDRQRLIEWAERNPSIRLHPDFLELTTEEGMRMKGWKALLLSLIRWALPERSLPEDPTPLRVEIR